MHDSESRAEEVYKIVIQKYPKSVKVLKAYVRFLRDIKNDPWKAQKYDLQAENYDQVSQVTAGLPRCAVGSLCHLTPVPFVGPEGSS